MCSDKIDKGTSIKLKYNYIVKGLELVRAYIQGHIDGNKVIIFNQTIP